MNKYFQTLVFALAAMFTFSVSADEVSDLKDMMKELQARIDAVEKKSDETAEIADAAVMAAEEGGTMGWWTNTSIGGYGEMHYENNKGSAAIDFHRYVLFINHDFNDIISFNSEFELEHAIAGEGKVGEVELEQAYIEHKWSQFGLDNTSAKYGVFLIPCGITNETHEPNTFYGVERNTVEKEICSNTRWEGGVQIKHVIPDQDLTILAGIHSPLNTSNGDIRGGRQKVGEATMNVPAYTAAIRYTGVYPGLELGYSFDYEPDMSANQLGPLIKGVMHAVHANYMPRLGYGMRSFYGVWDLECPEYIGSGNKCIQEGRDKQFGYFVEGSYRWEVSSEYGQTMGVFMRRSNWDDKAGTKLSTNTSNKISQTDFGINYWLTDNAVLKADWETQKQYGEASVQGFNLGMGYQF
ncbi:porin [Alphaproteobacteria bacterium]|nr:porin [Alphaproteobacteria bacterium]